MKRGYQLGYSATPASVHDEESRARKARTILAVLDEWSRGPLSGQRVLDVGASTGAIDDALAERFASVVGIDIDAPAIESARKRYARPNLEFRIGDAMALEFGDESFDIVVCTHVYEHVPDPDRLMEEIFRVLVPGGVCYFGAGNRFALDEPHYHLPLLSVIPKPLAHLYLRALGRGDRYYETHRTYWGLIRLTRRFVRHDFTARLVDESTRFGTDYMLPPGSLKARVAAGVVKWLYWLCPGYIWLLEKPRGPAPRIDPRLHEPGDRGA